MIIDSHVHLFNLPDSPLAKTTFAQNLTALQKEMRANRVGHAFILANYRRKRPDAPATEDVLKLVRGLKNISVLGSVDIENYGQADLDELGGWLERKEIVGVKLYPGYQKFYPNSPACEPVYKLCLKHGVPVIFHSGDTWCGDGETAKVKYSHPLVIDDVASEHPDLKIVIAHMGNPWLTDCAEVLYKNENVYADLSGLVVGTPLNSPYGRLTRRRVLDLMAYCSPRKLLYGTDWPLSAMGPYLKFVRGLGLGKADAEFVFHKNAEKLFGIRT